MIISRRYVPFLDLYYIDDASRKILYSAFEVGNLSEKEKERMFKYYSENRISIANAELGDCIPNFAFIKEKFDELDKSTPLDNGYTIDDIKDVRLVGKEEDSISVELYTVCDGIKHPVSVINLVVSNNDNKLSINSDCNISFNVI